MNKTGARCVPGPTEDSHLVRIHNAESGVFASELNIHAGEVEGSPTSMHARLVAVALDEHLVANVHDVVERKRGGLLLRVARPIGDSAFSATRTPPVRFRIVTAPSGLPVCLERMLRIASSQSLSIFRPNFARGASTTAACARRIRSHVFRT